MCLVSSQFYCLLVFGKGPGGVFVQISNGIPKELMKSMSALSWAAI